MELIFSSQAWEDYLYWQNKDKRTIKRINTLIKDIKRSPCDGIGKPESLKYSFTGYWSRRINSEHRLIYKIKESQLLIAQLRYHY